MSFLGRGVAGRLSQTALNGLKDYLVNCTLTCDVKVKPSVLAIAAGVAAYPTIGPQSIPEAISRFHFSVDGPLDFVHLGRRDSKNAFKQLATSGISPVNIKTTV